MQRLRKIYGLLSDTVDGFLDDNCSMMGGAIAFYTALSLAPMLLIFIGVVGIIYGGDDAAARDQVVAQTAEYVGKEGAQAVEATLSGTKSKTGGVVSTVVGVLSVLVGATGVFAQLQESLNIIWKVDPPPKVPTKAGFLAKVWAQIRNRLLSFSVLCGLAFLMLVSLAMSTAIGVVQGWMSDRLGDSAILMRVVNVTLSVGLATLLFAMIFKVLPARKITWSRVMLGAFVTSLLFNVGKSLIGVYLSQTAAGSSFGAAGSLMVLLIWIYYSTQILLLGAEFTKVYAKQYGGMPAPEPELQV